MKWEALSTSKESQAVISMGISRSLSTKAVLRLRTDKTLTLITVLALLASLVLGNAYRSLRT